MTNESSLFIQHADLSEELAENITPVIQGNPDTTPLHPPDSEKLLPWVVLSEGH